MYDFWGIFIGILDCGMISANDALQQGNGEGQQEQYAKDTGCSTWDVHKGVKGNGTVCGGRDVEHVIGCGDGQDLRAQAQNQGDVCGGQDALQWSAQAIANG